MIDAQSVMGMGHMIVIVTKSVTPATDQGLLKHTIWECVAFVANCFNSYCLIPR